MGKVHAKQKRAGHTYKAPGWIGLDWIRLDWTGLRDLKGKGFCCYFFIIWTSALGCFVLDGRLWFLLIPRYIIIPPAPPT